MTPLEDRVNPVAVSITAGAPITEGGSDSAFTISRDNSSGSLTVNVSYSGTASQGFDYFAMITSILFSDGQSSQPLPISPWDDGSVEGTETIIASISSSMNYTISGTGSATMNLYDNDTTQVTVAKQGGDPTEGGNGTFRITRSGSTSGDLTVNFTVGGTATSGTDFTSIGTSAKITSGNSYVDVSVPTLADNAVEASNETVTITITDGGSTYTALPSANASLSITDDPPVVSIEATDTDEGANGKFRISRTGGKISDSLTVYYSVTGGSADSADDFTALSGSVVIGGGNSYADVTVAALADNLIEGDEDLEVTITSGSYTISAATDTLIITDDPPVASVARYEDGEEGGSDGTFRVSRTGGDISEALVVTYTVGGTAVGASDVDYVELSGTVTIPSSAAYADITIDVTNDGSTEGTETVTLTLDTDEDWLNGSASDTLFIWDNEGTFVYWTGAEDDNWMNADNWSGNAVPDSDDIVVFNGSYVDDVTLSGPLSPYSIGELRITSGYTGTITLSFPLSVGSLSMKGGTIDQPYSAYGSDVTVTGTALWTGGVLNSTANIANVIFDGATALLSPAGAGTISTGSGISYDNGAQGILHAGVLDVLNDGVEFVVAAGSTLVAAPGNDGTFSQGNTIFGTPMHIFGYFTLLSGTFNQTGNVVNLGTLTLMENTTFSCSVPETPANAYDQTGAGASTIMYGGSNLVATAGYVIIRAGILTTKANSSGNADAIITAGLVKVRGGEISIDGGGGPHHFGQLFVSGSVNWDGGTFRPVVDDELNPGPSDVWNCTGTFAISDTAAIAPSARDGEDNPVMPTSGRQWEVIQGNNVTRADGAPSFNDTIWDLEEMGSPVTKLKLKAD